jgi:hypothetical protein
MLQTLLICLAGAYLFSVLISAVLLKELAQERSLWRAFVWVAIIAVPLSVWVLAKLIFVKPKPVGFSSELARIEDEIDAERVQIFGGKRVYPSIGDRWRTAYLAALQSTASTFSKKQELRAVRAASSH